MKYRKIIFAASLLLAFLLLAAASLLFRPFRNQPKLFDYRTAVPLLETDTYNQFTFDWTFTAGGPGEETETIHKTGVYACQEDISHAWDLTGTDYTESWETENLRYENRDGSWTQKELSFKLRLAELLNNRDTNFTITKEKDAVLISWDGENQKVTAVLEKDLTLSYITAVSAVSQEDGSGSVNTLTLVWTEQNKTDKVLHLPEL